MAKFKVGDKIEPKPYHHGFEGAVVIVDDSRYHLKIMNGMATIPIGAEVNYQLAGSK